MPALWIAFAAIILVACLLRLRSAKYGPRREINSPRFQVTTIATEHALQPQLAYVYVAGCSGLKAMHQALGSTCCWWKVGVVRAGSDDLQATLSNRLEALGKCAYAGMIAESGQYIEEPGFRTWNLQRLARPTRARSRDDVTLLPYAIAVRLPAHISFARFEAQLRGLLEPVSLLTLLSLRRRGPGCRYSRREDKIALATEIFALRPRCAADIERLLDAIIAILDAAH